MASYWVSVLWTGGPARRMEWEEERGKGRERGEVSSVPMPLEVSVCVCLHHTFLFVNHCMQKISCVNGSFSVEGTWNNNVPFLTEFNEETPKGWFNGKAFHMMAFVAPPSHCLLHLHLLISTPTSPHTHLYLHITTSILTSYPPPPFSIFRIQTAVLDTGR